MAVIEGGVSAVIAEVGAAAQKGLHVILKPTDAGTLGHYSWAGFTGILPAALAANSEVFQFRWTDATRLCVIRKVTISASVSTTFFAAGVPVQIDMVKATAWTVAGTGGATVTPAATMKKRTSFGSTLVAAGDIRPATTAALGVGTKTLEANSIGAVTAPGPITASLNGLILPPSIIYQSDIEGGGYPLTFAQNEGFVIRSVAVPATGTWTASIAVDWAEVVAY